MRLTAVSGGVYNTPMKKVRTQSYRPEAGPSRALPVAAVAIASLLMMGSAFPGTLAARPDAFQASLYSLPEEALRYIPPAQYAEWVYRYCAEAGLPVDEACRVVWQESRWDPNAEHWNLGKTPSVDRGLFQLNSRSLAIFALVYNNNVEIDPWDPQTNLCVGIRHLADLKSRFGSLKVALAAWNAGPPRALDPPQSTRHFIKAVLKP